MPGKSYLEIEDSLDIVRNVILCEPSILKVVHVTFVGRWIIDCFKGTQFE